MRWPDASVISTQFLNLQSRDDVSTPGTIALVWRGEGPVAPEALADWASTNFGTDVSLLPSQTITLPFTGHPDKLAPPFSYILIRR
jgi:hypothetical protein